MAVQKPRLLHATHSSGPQSEPQSSPALALSSTLVGMLRNRPFAAVKENDCHGTAGFPREWHDDCKNSPIRLLSEASG
ncbi:hypothetical protein ACLKA7_012330 [Drosophila subpalustris]